MASKLPYPYDTAANHLAAMKRRGDYWIAKDKPKPPMIPRAAGSGYVHSRGNQGEGKGKNREGGSPSERVSRRQRPEPEGEEKDSPSTSHLTGNKRSPSSPPYTPRPLASASSGPISFSPTPRQLPISRDSPAEWRHGVADWPWEAGQQMLLLNRAYTNLPFDDPFVEGGSGIQQTDDDNEHHGHQAGSQLCVMGESADESADESVTLTLSNSDGGVQESEEAQDNEEMKFQDVLRERNANLAKLEKASPAKATRAKRFKLWPSRATPPVPSSLLQLRRRQIDEAAVAEGMSSQETLTTRKKRLGTGVVRKMWTRLWAKKANRSGEFEEVLQTRSERLRPAISMPVLQTANPFVSMPSPQTTQSSLPTPGPQTNQSSLPVSGFQTTQASLPASGLQTTQPSLPAASSQTQNLGHVLPVPNFSRLMSPSTPKFPILHSPSTSNLGSGSPFLIDYSVPSHEK